MAKTKQNQTTPESNLHRELSSLQADVSASVDEMVDRIYSDYLLKRSLGVSGDREKLYELYPECANALRRQFAFEDALTSAGIDLPASTVVTGDSQPAIAGPAMQPERIGKYTVIATLGKGAQAMAFRVAHPDLQIEAVVKIAHAGATGTFADLAAEAHTLARVSHDHLVKVFDAGVWNGRPYLVSEYVAGQTLEQWARHRKVSAIAAAKVVAKLARGLQAAHDEGVCHLDIKPSNIVVGRHGELKIIDFGLALRRDPHGVEADSPAPIRGTFHYMPPEQARGELAAIGPRSDLFALGGVLFYLLTQHSPVPPSSMVEVYDRAVNCQWQTELLDSAEIPTPLRSTCRRAMERQPEDRFSSAAEFANELERFVTQVGARGVVGRRLLIGGAIATALAAALGIGFSIRGPRPMATNPSAMQLEDWDESQSQFLEIQKAWPLQSGDKVRIEALVPGDQNVAIFQYADGAWRQLTTAGAGKEQLHRLAFPSLEPNTATEIAGVPATDVLVIIAHRKRMPSVEDLPDLEGLPNLPPEKVLHIGRLGSEMWTIAGGEQSKSFGTTVTVKNPAVMIEERMARWRNELAKEFEMIEAVAYYHGE